MDGFTVSTGLSPGVWPSDFVSPVATLCVSAAGASGLDDLYFPPSSRGGLFFAHMACKSASMAASFASGDGVCSLGVVGAGDGVSLAEAIAPALAVSSSDNV
jgi:hypothetical protein